MATTLRLTDLLKRLNDHAVDYVIVGGIAAVVHGSARVTLDLDICAPLDEPNLSRILSALRGLNPRFRMRPDKMRVPDDPERLRGLKNFYVDTDLVPLIEVEGVGAFQQVKEHSSPVDIGELTCPVLNLDALISAKRAANRAKGSTGSGRA
jgi:hypothetical protein